MYILSVFEKEDTELFKSTVYFEVVCLFLGPSFSLFLISIHPPIEYLYPSIQQSSHPFIKSSFSSTCVFNPSHFISFILNIHNMILYCYMPSNSRKNTCFFPFFKIIKITTTKKKTSRLNMKFRSRSLLCIDFNFVQYFPSLFFSSQLKIKQRLRELRQRQLLSMNRNFFSTERRNPVYVPLIKEYKKCFCFRQDVS